MKLEYVFVTAIITFLTFCSIILNSSSQAADLTMSVNMLTLVVLLFGIAVVIVISLEIVHTSKKILKEPIE